jgi:hypothetical protein
LHVVKNKVVAPGPSLEIIEIVTGEEMEVCFKLWSWAEVKKCGVHIAVDESKAIGRYGSADQCVYSDTVSGDTTVDDQVSGENFEGED